MAVSLQEVPLRLRRCEPFKKSDPFPVQEYMCSMKIQNSASHNILLHSGQKFSSLKNAKMCWGLWSSEMWQHATGWLMSMFQVVVVSFWKVTSMICFTSGRPLLRCQCMNKIWDASQLPFNLLSLSLARARAHTYTHTGIPFSDQV